MRLPGASHWIGAGEVGTADLAAIPKDILPFQQPVRLGQSVVRHRRQKVMGEVVAILYDGRPGYERSNPAFFSRAASSRGVASPLS